MSGPLTGVRAAENTVPANLRRGRGANLNPAPRFDRATPVSFDDGWNTLADLAELPPLPTTLSRDASKTVISYNQSPDLGFDRSVNPYRGCEHGCVYCYARPSHAYLGYSPGLDFETRLVFKPDVAVLLEKELKKPGYVPQTLALGTNTDPYQPVERTLKLTRSVLEVLERHGHPVSIVTKSATILRDTDILQRLAARGLVRVWISVTTLDPELARRMEPRAAAPQRRLATIAALSNAGIPTGLLAAPMIPGLNDPEMEAIMERAARAGAGSAGFILLRLPNEVKTLFENWLHEHYPDRAKHVLSLIRDVRGGGLNDSQFHERFSGKGPYAELLSKRFERASRQWGFSEPEELPTRFFAVPNAGAQAVTAQLALF
jgi:DNA repair photolyase